MTMMLLVLIMIMMMMATINLHILEGEDLCDIDIVVTSAVGDVEEGVWVFEKG